MILSYFGAGVIGALFSIRFQEGSLMSTTRRRFLTTTTTGTLATAAVPYFGWQNKTLADESKAKNDRVAIGLIGAGGMGCVLLNISSPSLARALPRCLLYTSTRPRD